ncbi:MAG: hypothetical protein IKS90_00900 [Clostridia bacterium]|nr:hypothetical protein [Clostridia bacterium]
MCSKKKRFIALIAIAVLGLAFNFAGRPSIAETGGESDAKPEVDYSDWDEYFEKIRAVSPQMNENSAEELVGSIAEGEHADIEEMLGALLKIFVPTLKRSLERIAGVFALAVLTGVVSTAFGGDDGIGKTLVVILTVAAAAAMAAEFASLAKSASDAASSLSAFTETVSPTLTILLLGTGYTGSSALLSSRFAMLANGISIIMRSIILPLSVLSGVLSAVNGVSDLMNFERAIKLIARSIKWIIGLITTVFTAAVVLGGAASGTSDGVSVRAARYAVDRMLPAGGALITGTVQTAGAGALAVKNAAGITAIVLLVGILITPLTELAGGMAAFRLAAAFCEPFSDEKLPRMLDGAADSVGYMLSALAAGAAMFTLSAVMVILLGSAVI